jgi:NAD(P)H-quinone oxidoreductase subunit 5
MGIVFITVGTGQGTTALTLLLTYALAMSLLIMSVGGIILNNISQDLTQYGGLWARRPISGICYLIGAASLVAFPPLSGFWSLNQICESLWTNSPLLVGVIVLVNGLTSFSVMREFSLIFGGEVKPMTVRSPEGLWPLVLPMTILGGIALHTPILMWQWGLLPDWESLNLTVSRALFGSTLFGSGLALFIYLGNRIAKPIQLKPKALQDFFAYDLYTPQLYKITIVAAVGLLSQLIYWFDRFIIDGMVNLVGLFTVFGGQTLKYNVSGQTQFYVLTIVLGIALLGIFFGLPLLQLSF